VVVTAARNGHYDVTRLLVERMVDLDDYGPRACARASGHGHERIVQLLIEYGVQMPDQDDYCSITSSGYLNENSEEWSDEDSGHRSPRSDGGRSSQENVI
jgi:ankyrin repeat protein